MNNRFSFLAWQGDCKGEVKQSSLCTENESFLTLCWCVLDVALHILTCIHWVWSSMRSILRAEHGWWLPGYSWPGNVVCSSQLKMKEIWGSGGGIQLALWHTHSGSVAFNSNVMHHICLLVLKLIAQHKLTSFRSGNEQTYVSFFFLPLSPLCSYWIPQLLLSLTSLLSETVAVCKSQVSLGLRVPQWHRLPLCFS